MNVVWPLLGFLFFGGLSLFFDAFWWDHYEEIPVQLRTPRQDWAAEWPIVLAVVFTLLAWNCAKRCFKPKDKRN
jgi:hypothetical protein